MIELVIGIAVCAVAGLILLQALNKRLKARKQLRRDNHGTAVP